MSFKMYQCAHCQKIYVWSSDLNTHVKKHTSQITNATVVSMPPAAAAAAPAAAPSPAAAPAAAAPSPAAAAAPPAAAAPSPATATALNIELELSTNLFVFQQPFTMTLSEPIGGGKTMFFLNVIRYKKIKPMPDRIVYLYKQSQPRYDHMRQECPGIEFIKGIPSNLDNDSFLDIKLSNLIPIDYLMHRQNETIAELFTEGLHHGNLCVINVTQNMFPSGKHAVIQIRNTQYMIILKLPIKQD